MRVLVCGGRNYFDAERVVKILDALPIEELCHGGANGADTLAARYCEQRKIPCREYMADWGRYGRAAGPTRNKQMLVDFDPDFVVAFPGGRGTAHMVKLAREAGLTVYEVPESWIALEYVVEEEP